ncbi:hypothetical protein BJ138DRAFT_1159361 [Hygrophoropsis aurantiaca]|uniref:Uncharacterized protein n=1 Tax=Hygrophoropsis aurantiaca TaxID=72124 RepID=A0ACB8A3K6_9AGAM|nr:hypothetical protein BJ138DRAFT_1159361 [Hygrophoropsis aurantiaca]
MYNHEFAITDALAKIQVFFDSLQEYESDPRPGTSNIDKPGNRNGQVAAKLRGLKQSVEDLRRVVQDPLSTSSPAAVRQALAVVIEEHIKFSKCVNSFSLIYRLPTEILVIIFELAGRAKRRSELRISCVSRHWRDIAVNTPSLWTKWDAGITPSNDLLPIYFHRSSNLKVDADLRDWEAQTQTSVCQACASEGQTEKYHLASELLELSMHRFRALKISSIITPLATFLERITRTIPSSPIPSFASLTYISINAQLIDSDASPEQDPLLNFYGFQNILSASPNLAVLQLAVWLPNELMDSLSETPCIELPSLVRLCLNEIEDELTESYSSFYMLATLKAPKLRQFECHHTFCSEEAHQLRGAFFMHDGTPRFPSVQELTLNGCGIYHEFEDNIVFFDAVVRAFPNVIDVTLKDTDIGQLGAALNRAIQSSEGGDASDPWPCLRHLSLYRPSGIDLSAICTWLKSRSERIREPQRLSFKVKGPFQDNCKQAVSCLKEMEAYGDLVLEKIDLKELQQSGKDSLDVPDGKENMETA